MMLVSREISDLASCLSGMGDRRITCIHVDRLLYLGNLSPLGQSFSVFPFHPEVRRNPIKIVQAVIVDQNASGVFSLAG